MAVERIKKTKMFIHATTATRAVAVRMDATAGELMNTYHYSMLYIYNFLENYYWNGS